MKFSCYKSDLSNALNFVSRAVAPKPMTPILSGIYLKANDNFIELQANNLATGIVTKIPASVEVKGEIAVSGKRFVEFIKNMPDDTISADVENSSIIRLSSGGASVELLAMNPADFLPIPDAPDFEINSELICRNVNTGKFLQSFVPKTCQNFCYHVLTPSGKDIIKTAKTFRAQAVAAVTDSTFEPIPSLDGCYEINQRGIVRNVKTKRINKLYNNREVKLINNNGKRIYAHPNTYLWEVHGYYRKPKKQKVKCSAENEWGKHFFDSLADCARFLAPKVFLAVLTIRVDYLSKRTTEIDGWKITYYEDDPSADNWNRQALGFEALRMQKLDAERGLA